MNPLGFLIVLELAILIVLPNVLLSGFCSGGQLFFSLAAWNLGLVAGHFLAVGIPPAVESSQALWDCVPRQGALAKPASRIERPQTTHEAPSPNAG